MYELTGAQFLQSIKEVFDTVFKEYGFALREEAVWSGDGEYLVTATRGEITLKFWLSVVPMSPICYLTFVITLTGELAKKATSKRSHRETSLGPMNFAEILEPDFQHPPSEIRTTQELRERLEREKAWLLKYCQGVFSGDVSMWSMVEKGLDEK